MNIISIDSGILRTFLAVHNWFYIIYVYIFKPLPYEFVHQGCQFCILNVGSCIKQNYVADICMSLHCVKPF